MQYESVTQKNDSSPIVVRGTNEGKQVKLRFDQLLVATGRLPNVDGLNLEGKTKSPGAMCLSSTFRLSMLVFSPFLRYSLFFARSYSHVTSSCWNQVQQTRRSAGFGHVANKQPQRLRRW